jgi:hypothetical protein
MGDFQYSILKKPFFSSFLLVSPQINTVGVLRNHLTSHMQPELSVSGKDWMEVADRCKKELEMAIDSYEQKIKEWEDSMVKFREFRRKEIRV